MLSAAKHLPNKLDHREHRGTQKWLRRLMLISENIARVRERIAAAAQRAGRQPDDISLMAVSKTFPPDRIREAYDAGIRLFGENRVQEFAGKSDAVRDLGEA